MAAAMAVTATTATTGRFSRDRRGTRSGYPAVLHAHDELHALEDVGDRGALVVDESRRQPGRLHRVEVQIGRDLRRLLRPRDPQAPGRRDRRGERREALGQVTTAREEADDDVQVAPSS